MSLILQISAGIVLSKILITSLTALATYVSESAAAKLKVMEDDLRFEKRIEELRKLVPQVNSEFTRATILGHLKTMPKTDAEIEKCKTRIDQIIAMQKHPV